jgi:hypothetical protein
MANSIYDFLPSEATDSQTGGVNTAEGQNPSTVNDAQRNWKQLVAKFIDDLGGVNTVGGTATAVTVTAAQGWDGYGSGEGQIDSGAVLALKMGADATGAATLAVNSLTAKKIRKQGDVAVAAGDWVQNGIYLLRYDTAYDAANGAWVLLNPAGATAAQGALADTAAPQSTTYTKTEVNGLVAGAAGFRNRLINGNGRINQRGVTSSADDTYAWDRHNVLTQTAAIGISTLSDVANGLPSMMRLTQSQASAQRMGNSQIIESGNCKDLRGQAVTLLGKLRCSAAQAVRFAILEWTGAADAVTSDVVNSWTNGTFTAGQFFISSNLTVTAVGSLTPSAATVTDFSLTATLGASVNNVIVMIWTEGTAAQNVTLDVAWELARGDATGQTYPLEVRAVGDELALCQRYFQPLSADYRSNGQFASTTTVEVAFPFVVPMRAPPTASVSSRAVDAVGSGGTTFSAVGSFLVTATGGKLSMTGGSPARRQDQQAVFTGAGTLDAEL